MVLALLMVQLKSFARTAMVVLTAPLGLIGVTLALLAMWRITESPFGYIMRTLRDNQRRAAFLGINVRLHMLINFVIAGSFAGLAGAAWFFGGKAEPGRVDPSGPIRR